MKMLLRCLALIALAAALLIPVGSFADEAQDYEADARFAEGSPPTIPHHIEDKADGEACLVCHRMGLNGAPLCPHQVRITCTECHVPANPDAVAPKDLKKGKKRK